MVWVPFLLFGIVAASIYYFQIQRRVKRRRAVALLAGLIAFGRAFVRAIKWELGLLLLVLLLCMLPTANVFRWSFRWLPLLHLILALCAAESLRLFAANLQKAFYGFEPDFFQHNLLRIVDDAIGVIKSCIELWPTLVEICYFQKTRNGLPMRQLGLKR